MIMINDYKYMCNVVMCNDEGVCELKSEVDIKSVSDIIKSKECSLSRNLTA